MLNNQLRRQLLERHKQSGFPGSIIDVYKAYEQGIDIISNFEQQQMQQQMQVAQTPQQQQAGLRPFHQAGNTSQSMVFPNVPPNTPFNTVGMKAPINIEKYDKQGHLVKSYENVPPGIENLPTGPSEGTVIETPANMQSGGRRKYQSAGFNVTTAVPEWRATGPGMMVDGKLYQDTQRTGNTLIQVDPETGEQIPILLPTADVYPQEDSITGAMRKTGAGLFGSAIDKNQYNEIGDEIRSARDEFALKALSATGDIMSKPQQYLINAPLALAMGKKPNLSMFPSTDRLNGIDNGPSYPSQTLGITNPYGAFATDALTDPSVLVGMGLARQPIQQGLKQSGKYLTQNTPLKNAWKLNPKAYQYNLPENTMWRGLGKEGMEDAVQSGVFRSKQNIIPEYYPGTKLRMNKSFGNNPYFTPKFNTASTYGDNFIAEVPRSSANWKNRYARSDWSQIADREIPVTEGRILQKDWWKGYSPSKSNLSGGFQSGGKRKYQSGGSDEQLYPEFPINLLPAEIVANIPEAPSEKIPWYSTINFRKWGLRDYGDDVKFGKAFRDAFNRGEEQFVWRGDRFTTKMKSSEDIKQTSPTINAEPQIPKFDYDLFKRGVKYVESKDGVESLMMNPKSTATGLYGQRYSELVEFPQFKNLPREVFARDTALQNKVLDMRVKGKFEGIPGVEDSAKDLYLEYKDQIKDFPYDVTEVGALVNFLGRQGTREYFGYVLRDKKSLENIFPKLYGPKKEQPNKTPEKYIEEFRSRYLLGGNLNNYPRYPKKVSYNNKRSN